MGNYMETCIQRNVKVDEESQLRQDVEHEKQEPQNAMGDYGSNNGPIRVKLVLTKDELEWLLLQLKNKKGKSLEGVLEEIGKSRMRAKSVVGWKPSLDSIMETPEIHNEMIRS